MGENRNKRFYWFTAGMFAGLVLGGSMAWFISEHLVSVQISNWEERMAQNNAKTIATPIKVNKTASAPAKKEKLPGVTSEPGESDQNHAENAVPDTTTGAAGGDSAKLSETVVIDSIHQDTMAMNMASETSHVSDTDRIIDSSANSDDHIIVKKDELLLSLKIPFIFLDSLTIHPEDQDSLNVAISGIKNNKKEELCTVEFWRSPINYTGYKMANNKLVLFGLDEEYSHFQLLRLKNQTYLKHNSDYFQIDHTFAFRPFRKIKDEGLLKQLIP